MSKGNSSRISGDAKRERDERILRALKNDPELEYTKIAQRFGCSASLIGDIALAAKFPPRVVCASRASDRTL